MITDPISDMLTRIKNGYLANKDHVLVPYSLFKEQIIKVIQRKGFVTDFSIKESGNHRNLDIILKYEEKKPVITEIRKVSKPGLKVYCKKNKLPWVLNGLGIAIISTPKGLMTDKEARKSGLGGEIICKIW